MTICVASAPDFWRHHIVANGASDLLIDGLGPRGRHARTAFGVAALPFGGSVELEAVVRSREEAGAELRMGSPSTESG